MASKADTSALTNYSALSGCCGYETAFLGNDGESRVNSINSIQPATMFSGGWRTHVGRTADGERTADDPYRYMYIYICIHMCIYINIHTYYLHIYIWRRLIYGCSQE